MLRQPDGRAAVARAASHCARRSPRSSSGRPAAPSIPAARSSSRTVPCTRSGSASARSSGRATRSSSPPRASSSKARSARPARRPSTSTAAPPTAGAGMPRRSRRAVGPRTRAAPPLQPRQPDRPRPHAGRRSRRPSAVAARHGLLVVTDEAYEAALWDGNRLTSAFGLAGDVVLVRSLGKSLSLPQLRLGIVSGPARLLEPCARTLEWDVPPRRPRRPDSGARGARRPARLARRRPRRRSSRTAPSRSPPSPRRRGSAAAVPAAAPFLFVHAESGAPVGEGLARAGLPVVDGIHFQAPGYARLPFAGAARGGRRARGGTRPLGRGHRPGRVSARAEAAERRRGGRSR